MSWKSPFAKGSLHIFVLFSFAVPQPLFSLLSVYPEFFVARQSQPSDLILLALFLCLGVPSLLILFEAAARAVGIRLYGSVHGCLVWILVSTILTQLLKKIGTVPGVVVLGTAVLLATAATVAYRRFDAVRTYLTIISPAALVFPGLFFLNPGISKIVFPKQVEAQISEGESTTPVVMVVLDELPLSSIMDEHRRIDPIRFPNLARFAAGSHWFRNATTVSDYTLLSVPAILSGLRPRLHDPRLPTIGDYPDNLFTLLNNSHSLNVVENGTQLSPEQDVLELWPERMSSLLSDLTTLYAHVLLPNDQTSGLPAIDQSWKDFGSPRALQSELKTLQDFHPDIGPSRASVFRRFVDSIQADERPTLSFIHTMLPHVPWQYLPTGKQYSLTNAIPGLVSSDSGYGMFPAWGDNKSLVVQGYQRHTLQAGFVDTLVGELIHKLNRVNLYDRSLIVITADHGVSFRLNDFERKLTDSNHADIIWIPLFIKEPYQDSGVITDRNVETIDILPTMADILDLELPWLADGVSVLDPDAGERLKKMVLSGKGQELIFDSRLDRFYDSLERRREILGSGSWLSLYAYDPYARLVGELVQDFQVNEAVVGVELEGEALFEDVDLDAPFLPTRVSGIVPAGRDETGSQHLAISVNGRIQAVAEFDRRPNGTAEFSALVPDTALVSGKNDIDVFWVLDRAGSARLERLSKETGLDYVLMGSRDSRDEALQTNEGMSVPLVVAPNSGWVRTAINEESRTIAITGWAVNVKRPASDVTVLVFQYNRMLYSGRPTNERPDVAEVFPTWELSTPGFRFDLPLAQFDRDTEIRVFALLDDGTAVELAYVEDGWPFPLAEP